MTSRKTLPDLQDQAPARSEAERRKRTSSLATAGGLANVGVIATYQTGLFEFDDLDILECRHEVVKRVRQVRDGDTAHIIALLLAQGLALNSMFTKLALKAADVDGRNPRQAEAYLRMALKAQSQSRVTLEAVLAVGNPPVLFAQQANVAFGPLQVNNGAAKDFPHTKQNEIVPNKLLEADHGQRLDYGAQGQAVRADQDLEAVAAGNRASQP